MTTWLEYFVEGLHSQMKEIQARGELLITAEKITRVFAREALSQRQEKILKHVLVHERIDNEECQRVCGSIKRTATRDLANLVEKGILNRKGEKKGTYYVFSPASAEKVRDIKGQG